MKTVIKSILLGVSLLATFVALLIVSASSVKANSLANEKNGITTIRHAAFVTQTGNVINVNVEKPAGQSVRVEFVSKSGNVMAEQFMGREAGSFGCKFNVAQLPDGEYKVRIVGKETLGEYTFTLKTPTVETPSRVLIVQ